MREFSFDATNIQIIFDISKFSAFIIRKNYPTLFDAFFDTKSYLQILVDTIMYSK